MTKAEALTLAFERAIAVLTRPFPVKEPYTFTLEQRIYLGQMRADMQECVDRARMLAMLGEQHIQRIDAVLANEDDGA